MVTLTKVLAMTSAIPCAAGENRADGIGKRAASGKERDDLPRLEAKSILNCCPNWDMPLDDQPFSRLRVCCARYAHEYMGMEDGGFQARRTRWSCWPRTVVCQAATAPVAMDTATDPYQQLSKIGLDARDLLDRCTGIWEN
jgi:hypothetical protein